MAADTLAKFFERTRADEDATWPYKMDRSLSYAENRLICGIKLANLRIFESSRDDLRYRGMGTTVVAALLVGDTLHVAHVGDSRLYCIRGREITRLTRDHSLLEDHREAKPDLTAEEERAFPHKNVITRALGMRERVEVAVGSYEIAGGDNYLLCTDGLSGMIDDADIFRIVSRAPEPERKQPPKPGAG